MNSKTHNNKGFTLIETLIAISILTIAVGSAFGIAQKSLQTSAFSKNQTTAYFLAAEGLEFVRAIRDNTAITNNANPGSAVDWLETFKSECGALSGCVFDIYQNNQNLIIKRVPEDPSYCSSEKGCRLKILSLDPSNPTPPTKTYSSGGTGDIYSMFYRKITIAETDAGSGVDDEGNPWQKYDAVVTSTVFWGNESFTLRETLTNWQ